MAAMPATAPVPAMPRPAGRPFTVDDLERMPDDGMRYELLDGVLLVSPAPRWGHQAAQAALHRLLHAACPRDLRVVGAPFGWRDDRYTELQPDVVVARFAALSAVPDGRHLAEAPVLAVEVHSRSTRRLDRTAKRSKYEEAGIASYWMVEPSLEQPAVQAFDLVDGGYVEVAHVRGDERWTAEQPFPVTVQPSALLADLRPRSGD